jgi:hypothetical protein
VRTHTEACLEDKVVIALGTLCTSALHKRRHVQLGDEVTVTLRGGGADDTRGVSVSDTNHCEINLQS